MNILVTGACGFIGTNLCHSLLEDGFFVTGVDAFTDNYQNRLKKANQKELEKFKNFSLIECDLLEADLAPLVEGIEVIFHLAGQPSVHNSWGEDFHLYSNRNIALTQRLLRAANKAKTASSSTCFLNQPNEDK